MIVLESLVLIIQAVLLRFSKLNSSDEEIGLATIERVEVFVALMTDTTSFVFFARLNVSEKMLS